MTAVKRVDRRRQACRLASEAGHDEIAAVAGHHFREVLAGVTRRLLALEYRIRSVRLEAVDPARKASRRIEKGRSDPACKCDRNSGRTRVHQRRAAIGKRGIDIRNSQRT